MPEVFSESWEYYEPDPEIAELLDAPSRGLASLVGDESGFSGTVARRPERRDECVICRKIYTTSSAPCASAPNFYQCCSRVCGALLSERRWARKALVPRRCSTCRCVFANRAGRNVRKYCSVRCVRPVAAPVAALAPLAPEEARALIDLGVTFGAVFPHVPAPDQSALREWFCRRVVSPCSPSSVGPFADSSVTATVTTRTGS